MIDIIPAIDLIGGKCVRLQQGDFDRQTTYGDDPVVVAKQFEDAGLKRLHLVDLDGAKTGAMANLGVLERIAKQTNLVIDFGGGIQSQNDLQNGFDAGAAMVGIGSLAVKRPDLVRAWAAYFGYEKLMLGADVKDEKLMIRGWKEATTVDIFTFIQNYSENGFQNFFCTDISKDGMLEGAAVKLYGRITQKFPGINFIASGGIGSINDIEMAQHAGCKGVIVGKAIYEQKISLQELQKFMIDGTN